MLWDHDKGPYYNLTLDTYDVGSVVGTVAPGTTTTRRKRSFECGRYLLVSRTTHHTKSHGGKKIKKNLVNVEWSADLQLIGHVYNLLQISYKSLLSARCALVNRRSRSRHDCVDRCTRNNCCNGRYCGLLSLSLSYHRHRHRHPFPRK